MPSSCPAYRQTPEKIHFCPPSKTKIRKQFNHDQYIAGGATLNAVRVAQWVMGAANAGKASFVGAIGTDAFGKQMKEQARAPAPRALTLTRPVAPGPLSPALRGARAPMTRVAPNLRVILSSLLI